MVKQLDDDKDGKITVTVRVHASRRREVLHAVCSLLLLRVCPCAGSEAEVEQADELPGLRHAVRCVRRRGVCGRSSIVSPV